MIKPGGTRGTKSQQAAASVYGENEEEEEERVSGVNDCLPAAGRENRKSDWPWRKRAEQKPHAEFSVGRSSIIGARYRPVTQAGRQAGRQARQCGDTPARCARLSLTVCYCAGAARSGAAPWPSGYFTPGHLVNLAHRRSPSLRRQPVVEIVVDTKRPNLRYNAPLRRITSRMIGRRITETLIDHFERSPHDVRNLRKNRQLKIWSVIARYSICTRRTVGKNEKSCFVIVHGLQIWAEKKNTFNLQIFNGGFF